MNDFDRKMKRDLDRCLSPCPLCAGPAEINYTLPEYTPAPRDDVRISCEDCDLELYADTIEEAIEAWNKRAVLPTRKDRFKELVRERIGSHWLALILVCTIAGVFHPIGLAVALGLTFWRVEKIIE